MKREKPTIINKTIVIDDTNAADYVDGVTRYAGFEPAFNRIYLYKYVMSPSISDEFRPRIQRTLDYTNTMRPAALPHEMRHWYNGAVIQPTDGNYFASISLLLIDELSAMTAGNLRYMPEQTAPITPRAIANAMADECHQYLEKPLPNGRGTYYEQYRDEFIDWATWAVHDYDMEHARQKELLRIYDRNPDALFTQDYHDRLSTYLTFGDYCILNDKNTKDQDIIKARKYLAEYAIPKIKCDVATRLAEKLKTIVR